MGGGGDTYPQELVPLGWQRVVKLIHSFVTQDTNSCVTYLCVAETTAEVTEEVTSGRWGQQTLRLESWVSGLLATVRNEERDLTLVEFALTNRCLFFLVLIPLGKENCFENVLVLSF